MKTKYFLNRKSLKNFIVNNPYIVNDCFFFIKNYKLFYQLEYKKKDFIDRYLHIDFL